jgi:hypothetical protein
MRKQILLLILMIALCLGMASATLTYGWRFQDQANSTAVNEPVAYCCLACHQSELPSFSGNDSLWNTYGRFQLSSDFGGANFTDCGFTFEYIIPDESYDILDDNVKWNFLEKNSISQNNVTYSIPWRGVSASSPYTIRVKIVSNVTYNQLDPDPGWAWKYEEWQTVKYMFYNFEEDYYETVNQYSIHHMESYDGNGTWNGTFFGGPGYSALTEDGIIVKDVPLYNPGECNWDLDKQENCYINNTLVTSDPENKVRGVKHPFNVTVYSGQYDFKDIELSDDNSTWDALPDSQYNMFFIVESGARFIGDGVNSTIIMPWEINNWDKYLRGFTLSCDYGSVENTLIHGFSPRGYGSGFFYSTHGYCNFRNTVVEMNSFSGCHENIYFAFYMGSNSSWHDNYMDETCLSQYVFVSYNDNALIDIYNNNGGAYVLGTEDYPSIMTGDVHDNHFSVMKIDKINDNITVHGNIVDTEVTIPSEWTGSFTPDNVHIYNNTFISPVYLPYSNAWDTLCYGGMSNSYYFIAAGYFDGTYYLCDEETEFTSANAPFEFSVGLVNYYGNPVNSTFDGQGGVIFHETTGNCGILVTDYDLYVSDYKISNFEVKDHNIGLCILSCKSLVVENVSLKGSTVGVSWNEDKCPVEFINFESECVPDWQAQYGACNVNQSLKYYTDTNQCYPRNISLPVDNSTYITCSTPASGGIDEVTGFILGLFGLIIAGFAAIASFRYAKEKVNQGKISEAIEFMVLAVVGVIIITLIVGAVLV